MMMMMMMFILYTTPLKCSYFITLLEPPPLCWRHTTFLLFLFIRFWLQHHSASAFSPTDIFLDDCYLLTVNLSKMNFFLLASNSNLPKLTSATGYYSVCSQLVQCLSVML